MRSRLATMVLAAAMVLGALVGVPATASPSASAEQAAVDVALRHLEQHRADYGLTQQDTADVVVADAYRSAHNGVTHVYLQQRHRGLELAGATMTVNVTAGGEVLHVGNRLLAGVAQDVSGTLLLTAAGAVQAAAAQLGLAAPEDLRLLQVADDAARMTLLSDGGVSAQPIPARLLFQPAQDGRIRLAWNLEIEERASAHWWNISIDAGTGTLLAKLDYTAHDTVEGNAAAIARPGGGGAAAHATAHDEAPSLAPQVQAGPDGSRYRVYALPLESPNDGPRTLVSSPADETASPFGWHDTNGAPGPEFTVTRGNNVDAYIDTFNAGTSVPIVTQPDGGSSLQFDHPIDFNTPPTVYKDAAVTNLFYWNNIIHDVFYRYGFTEEAGNFQVNNYDRGGAGNDDVRAEGQDGSGVNNANFATPADGSRPRMQMYVWPHTGTGEFVGKIRDGDLDAGIITHEYGHGISNRLTGGRTNVGCLGNQEQMGEGWSDWLAIALTAREGETGEQLRGMGTYALYQPSRQAKGIRPTAYSTNTSVNPATYNTIKTAAVPHGVGYVWATMLWEVYWALVAEHGFNPDVYGDWTTGGNNLAIQLVMDGMKMQPCRPGFVDGRDAILAADRALTDGENQCVIFDAFAKRGLGFSAQQGASSSRSDGTQAFDRHPDCLEPPETP